MTANHECELTDKVEVPLSFWFHQIEISLNNKVVIQNTVQIELLNENCCTYV